MSGEVAEQSHSHLGAEKRRDTKPVQVPFRIPRPQLRAINLIVLDGTLNQYSIRHTDINPTPLPKPTVAAQP